LVSRLVKGYFFPCTPYRERCATSRFSFDIDVDVALIASCCRCPQSAFAANVAPTSSAIFSFQLPRSAYLPPACCPAWRLACDWPAIAVVFRPCSFVATSAVVGCPPRSFLCVLPSALASTPSTLSTFARWSWCRHPICASSNPRSVNICCHHFSIKLDRVGLFVVFLYRCPSF